jgi:hypothetical protein
MPKRKKLTWQDHYELLLYLVDHSVKQAAGHFGLTEGAVRNRLYNIRKKLQQTQAAINKIRNLQSISTRIRKFTTIGGVPEDDET